MVFGYLLMVGVVGGGEGGVGAWLFFFVGEKVFAFDRVGLEF